MVRVRLFGAPRVERDSRPITGRAVQRHPLALLAVIALAPRSTVSRDRLVARLWPDHGTARARHRLSVALHVLRKELGRDALASDGDSVRLNPGAVWTDVGDFTSLVAGGRLEEAAGLYVGPLLDGFFLRGVPEFEMWLETERARLASLYGTVLERLAREAESRGDRGRAHGYWTRLGAHLPYSGRTVLDVVHGLERAGDRIGALRRARAHAALVAAELGATPDPALLEAAERIASELDASRARGGGSQPTPRVGTDPPTPAPVHASHGADSPDAGNRTGPRPRATRAIRGAVVGVAIAAAVAVLLAAALTADRRAGPGPAAPVGGLAAIPFDVAGGDRGSADLGVELIGETLATLAYVPGLDTLASGEGLTLRGRIAVGERRLVVTAWVEEAATGELRWTRRYEAPVGDVGAARDEISLRMALDLRAHLAPYEPKGYTADRVAYDRFLEGVYSHRRTTPEALWKALQLYREALERDTSFALAHAVSANAYMALARHGVDPATAYDNARRHTLRALALDSTLAEGLEALARIRIWRDRDFEAAREAIRRALVLYPTMPQAYSTYGDYLLYARARPTAAIRSYRRALELDPLNAARSYTLERALYFARRPGEAVEQNRVTGALLPPDEAAGHAPAAADATRELGRLDEAIVAYRAGQALAGGVPDPGLAIALARSGRRDEALDLLATLERRYPGARSGWESLAGAYAAVGEPDRALLWLERAHDAGSQWLITVGVDPAFDSLRPDPRFQALLRRIGIPG
jgi:DNA-binding SARP family transcriptional activator